MLNPCRACFIITLNLLLSFAYLLEAQHEGLWLSHYADEGVGVSSNPSPCDHIGTGDLARELFSGFGLDEEKTGFSLESLWILDGNQLFSGGLRGSDSTTINNLLQFDLLYDTGKVSNWEGGLFSIQLLQLNGKPTNSNAGLVQGFEGLIESTPITRTEFYAWWYRQELLDGNLIFRVGKSTPNCDFNSVNRLFPMNDKRVSPEASGLIYGTIFTQGSLSSFLPNYYNSAFGGSVFYFPVDDFYVSLGAYDGNKARGEQTGQQGPQFNGYYFIISETGVSWSNAELPGRMAIGGWKQTGKFTLKSHGIVQDGICGLYLYGSQRLWWMDRENVNSGLVTFLQLGISNTKTLPIKQSLGWGLTSFGLVPCRLKDSFGFGVSVAGLNTKTEPHSSEWMFQCYYQCCLFESFYLEPVISYIPCPGAEADLPATWAGTVRLLVHF